MGQAALCELCRRLCVKSAFYVQVEGVRVIVHDGPVSTRRGVVSGSPTKGLHPVSFADGSVQSISRQKLELDQGPTGVFVKDGFPLRFFVLPTEGRSELEKKIIDNGGEIAKRETDAAVTTVHPGSDSQIPSCSAYVYSQRLVLDAIENNVCDLAQKEKYLLSAGGRTAFAGTRMQYSIEEDKAIVEFVKKCSDESALYVAGNKLWREAEKLRITNRTWQSMRERYLNFLAPTATEDSRKRKREEKNRRETCKQMILSIMSRTKASKQLVVHAGLIFSGNMELAEKYISAQLGPGEEELAWQYEEDKFLLDNVDQIDEMLEGPAKDRPEPLVSMISRHGEAYAHLLPSPEPPASLSMGPLQVRKKSKIDCSGLSMEEKMIKTLMSSVYAWLHSPISCKSLFMIEQVTVSGPMNSV